MFRILILAGIRPWVYISFHAVIVFGLGKNLLFKSILGLCEYIQIQLTFAPGMVRKCQIVEDARPAENMAALCHFGSLGRIQTDRA